MAPDEDDRNGDDTMIYTGTGLGHSPGVDREGTFDRGPGDRVEHDQPPAPDEPADDEPVVHEEPDDR